jgi:hypothetical protein
MASKAFMERQEEATPVYEDSDILAAAARLAGEDLCSINDLSNAEVRAILKLGHDVKRNPREYRHALDAKTGAFPFKRGCRTSSRASSAPAYPVTPNTAVCTASITLPVSFQCGSAPPPLFVYPDRSPAQCRLRQSCLLHPATLHNQAPLLPAAHHPSLFQSLLDSSPAGCAVQKHSAHLQPTAACPLLLHVQRREQPPPHCHSTADTRTAP